MFAGNCVIVAGIYEKVTGWVFGIADLAFRLEGPEHWLSALENTWSTWQPDSVLPPWVLTIKTAHNMPAPDAPLFEANLNCQDGVCTLQAPGFNVRIDAKTKCGEMLTHPLAKIADVGYFLRVAVAMHAFTQGAMLFHAACVAHHDKGYLLFGQSGSGKTTAAQLSDPDPVLNDDLLLLWPAEEGWLVYSTPFGKRRGLRRVVPLQAALRLVQDVDVYLAPLSPGRALTELVANSPIIAADRILLPELMARWMQFIDHVPVRALHFRKDPTFWEVIDAEWE